MFYAPMDSELKFNIKDIFLEGCVLILKLTGKVKLNIWEIVLHHL